MQSKTETLQIGDTVRDSRKNVVGVLTHVGTTISRVRFSDDPKDKGEASWNRDLRPHKPNRRNVGGD